MGGFLRLLLISYLEISFYLQYIYLHLNQLHCPCWFIKLSYSFLFLSKLYLLAFGNELNILQTQKQSANEKGIIEVFINEEKTFLKEVLCPWVSKTV